MLGLGLSIPQLATRGGRTLTLSQQVAALFASGAQGAWYDPSDYTTLFEDAAGTTPITTPLEKPVGKMLDKSGRGNHATQSTTTSRPTLSARYNLLTKTEQFDDGAWSKISATVTANTTATTDPLGGDTADKVLESAVTNLHQVGQLPILAGNYTWSFYAKAAERSFVTLTFATEDATRKWFNGIVDLSNGNSKVLNTLNSPTYSNFTATSVGNGWYRISVTFTTSNATGSGTLVAANISDSYSPSVDAYGRPSYTGDGTSGIYLWGADLRVANDGIGLPAYQRVNTATDYDYAGFPPYLKFDGTDDSMATGNIDFTGTDKMSVFAGVRKLSDAAVGDIAELSATADTNNGSFAVFNESGSGKTGWGFFSKGTAFGTAVVSSGYTAPITSVLSGTGNIAGDSAIFRINGAQAAISTLDQGTGNFGNYPLYIGRRGGTTLPYNGRLYSLVVCGKLASAAEITATEAWVNGKTKAF